MPNLFISINSDLSLRVCITNSSFAWLLSIIVCLSSHRISACLPLLVLIWLTLRLACLLERSTGWCTQLIWFDVELSVLLSIFLGAVISSCLAWANAREVFWSLWGILHLERALCREKEWGLTADYADEADADLEETTFFPLSNY